MILYNKLAVQNYLHLHQFTQIQTLITRMQAKVQQQTATFEP